MFIVFEGIDGAGKTEQSRRLGEWLREQGRRVVETSEPTDGKWGRLNLPEARVRLTPEIVPLQIPVPLRAAREEANRSGSVSKRQAVPCRIDTGLKGDPLRFFRGLFRYPKKH